MTDIPKAVLKEAKDLVSKFGAHFGYLGKYKGQDGYIFHFPEDQDTGFPFIYLYDRDTDNAFEITDFEALELLDKFE